MSALPKPTPPPLPAKLQDWHRKVKAERTLNDHVEDLHCYLVENSDDYRAYLRATYNSNAVEGSLCADNVKAAELLRDRATTLGNPVKAEKLATIVKCLGVVLRRYSFDRKTRRNTVGGEVVPNEAE